MIDIRHVYQTFGDRHILKDVSLSIKEGETMVILGASGSGKSTLLKLIIGLLRPTSGKVLVNGKDMGQLSEEELNEERRSMGMVFQYSALFDSLNVKENVAFGLRMHTRLSEEKIDAIVKEKLHLVGLDGIILYDEPTAGLDPIRSTDISLLIKETQKVLHATSVVVTHDLKSAEMIADRMAFLYKGSFLAVGTAKELYASKDERVRQFMNGLPSNPDFLKEGDA